MAEFYGVASHLCVFIFIYTNIIIVMFPDWSCFCNMQIHSAAIYLNLNTDIDIFTRYRFVVVIMTQTIMFFISFQIASWFFILYMHTIFGSKHSLTNLASDRKCGHDYSVTICALYIPFII